MAGPDEPLASRPRRAETAGPLTAIAASIAVVAVVAAVALVRGPGFRPPPAASPSAGISAGSPPAGSGGPGSTAPRPGPAVVTGAPPRVGAIAAVDDAGALSVITPDGRSFLVTRPDEVTVGFPAWSPDGTRLATIAGADGATTIEVVPVDAAAGTAGSPVAIYRSAIQQAFYVS